MAENCCENRPNFGRPTCVADLGVVERFIFVPLGLGFDLNAGDELASVKANLLSAAPADLWRPFPQVENFVWTPAESRFEESSNGKKSFLGNGKISITCETWDGDATAKMVSKMRALRCAKWGVYLVTNENLLIGAYSNSGGLEYVNGIKIDAQSIDALFQLKTDAATQKIMFSFDLDNNFDVSTLYSIDGNLIWDGVNEVIVPVDFVDGLPNVIDCQLSKNGAFITTGGAIVVNDDYRQGTRNVAAGDSLGNVTGLVVGNFLVENLTDATTVTPTSVTENGTGNYEFILPAQTAGDIVKISLVLDATAGLDATQYQGSITITIP